MRFGLPWLGVELANTAELAGVEVFCTGDFPDHDAYIRLAQMAIGTSSATVGTAIAYAFARTPYSHASAIRTAWAQAPGRVFAGFGTGAYSINRDWFGVDATRPMARLVDLVSAVRAWLSAENGDRVAYIGPFYRVDANVVAPVLGRVPAPILMAAFNEKMAGAAARVADGVIGHGLFTGRWWNDVVRPAVGRAVRERPEALVEHGWVITAIDEDDPARAVADVRRMIAFYLTVRTYDPYVAHHGWEPQVRLLRDAFERRDFTGMAEAVTDDMVEEIALCGSLADARSALARRRGSLPRDVAYLAPPSFGVSGRRQRRYAEASLSLVGARKEE